MNDKPLVIGIGELLWDCFADSRRPGGAPANVAYHAHQLGLDGLICSRVGRDDAGDDLIAELSQRGSDTSAVQRDPRHPTGWVTVETRRADQPTYVIHENVAWDYLEITDAWTHRFNDAWCVCFGTLGQRNEQSRRAIQHYLDAAPNAVLVYDVNIRFPWYTPVRIEWSLRRCNVLKLNESEVTLLGEMLNLPAHDPEGFSRDVIRRYVVDIVCITRAEKGCRVFSADASIEVPGEIVTVVDSVGAGDAFTAAFIKGLISNWPLETAARFANAAGARVASKAGATPEMRTEYATLEKGITD
jgi:fructokinase